MKKLIIFDLDGTLAKSKSAVDTEMLSLLYKLISVVKVAIISGGDWPQFEKQLINKLSLDKNLQNLFILPTCGTKFYQYTNRWQKLYSEDFSTDEKNKIIKTLKNIIKEVDFKVKKIWGAVIEDRGSQITYSALGQEAPLINKKKWDFDHSKRLQIKLRLEKLIPEFSVSIGGTTSIDITKKGIDKGYGVRKLCTVLDVSIQDVIFIGDALFPEGNDYPAKDTGVLCIQVIDSEETKRVIEAIYACLI